MYDILELSKKLLPELRDIARELKVKKTESLKKQDLIYKILDQQAIEATEKQPVIKSVSFEHHSSLEKSKDYDSEQRREKRPRTKKPILNRPVESVMSVSPDDIKKAEPIRNVWKDKVRTPEKTDKKSDLFRNTEPIDDHKPVPVWRDNKKLRESRENPPILEKDTSEKFLESPAEPVSEPLIETNAPLNSVDTLFDDTKAAKDVYFDDIIVEPPVKEIIPEVVQAREEKKEKPFEFEGIIYNTGVLEIMPDGYGFLRSADYNYLNSPDDIYVSQSQIKLFGLKTGDTIRGTIRPPKEGEKYFPLIKVDEINGRSPDFIRDRVPFDFLTPLFPNEKFTLCQPGEGSLSVRVIDMFTPLGKVSEDL